MATLSKKTIAKKTLAGAVAALAIGVTVAAASSPAAAFDSSGHHYSHHHHGWHREALVVRPYGLPPAYAYGQAPRYISGYYFTNSDFCIPDRNNGYNGGFSTLAYGANGRVLGYVCN